MRTKVIFVLLLSVVWWSPAFPQDAGKAIPKADHAPERRQDAGAGRRAKQTAAAERAACELSVAPTYLAKPGQQVTLTWTARNATSAKVDGIGEVSLKGKQAAFDRPDRTTTYEMQVAGPAGTGSCRVSVAVPQRTQPLQWPPAALANMPADYLVRARASLADAITNAKLINEQRWVGYAIASLMFEQDVDVVNKYFAERWEAPRHDIFGFGLFSVGTVRLYGLFNTRSGTIAGRLTPAAQRHIEDELYKVASQTRFNDYQFATNLDNVWTSRGSENRAFSARSSFLLASQFLKNSPDFQNRTFEDGRKPAEHYEAWRRFWSRLLDERAKRGLYVEVASPSYEDNTRAAIQNIRDFAEDPILRKKAEMLLDVSYALMAQDSLPNGIRGGAKSRVYTFKDTFFGGAADSDYDLIFGVSGREARVSEQATSTYFPPPVVLRLGQEAAKRGSFEYVQRVPGVGGMEARKLTRLDAEKSVLRYGFVTPSYVVGSFVLDPTAAYAPTSSQNRWQGVVFEGENSARIAPRLIRLTQGGTEQVDQRVHDGFIALQDRNVLILQANSKREDARKRVDIYFSEALDALEEQDGWIFARENRSFAAVRVVGQGADTYRWLEEAGEKEKKSRQGSKNFVTLRNANSPIVMVTSSAGDYGDDFARFKSALKGQKIEYDGRVLKFADLEFYGPQKIGSRAGKTVDVSPPTLYSSPFILSKWESGKIFMRFGEEALSLDFSNPDKPEKNLAPAITAEFPSGAGKTAPIIFGPR